MKNHKLISSMIAMSMAITACTSSSGPGSSAKPTAQDQVSQLGEAQEQWVKLTTSDRPNFALADLLSPWLWTLDPQGLKKVRTQTDALDMSSPSRQALVNHLTDMKLNMILGEKSYIQDPEIVKGAVFSQVTRLESEGAFSTQIHLQTVAEAQAQAFMKIQNAFNERMKKSARDIGREIVNGLDPAAIAQINGAKLKQGQEGIQQIYQALKKWDRILANYDFSGDDEQKLIIYGFVAAELYDFLKDHQTVQEIIRTVQAVQQISERINQARLVLKAMDQYRDNLADGWNEMKTAMDGMKNDIMTHPEWTNLTDLSDQTKKESVRVVTDILLGQETPNLDPSKNSILSGEHPLSKNAKMFFEGAAKTSQSVDNLITGTRTIAGALGIQIDPQVEDAMNKAQQITQGVQIAEQVAAGFSSNGLMGAFSALADTGGAAMVAGPAGAGMAAISMAQMNAQMGQMNQKLDKMIALQKQVLELQKQTLQKLEEMSYKLDLYHHEEMLAIQGVKNEVIENRRAIKNLIDKNLYSCGSLVSRLNSLDNTVGNIELNTLSTESDRANLAKLLANPKVRNTLLKESMTKQSYMNCTQAMTDAFSMKQVADSPLPAYQIGVANAATSRAIQDNLYSPALNLLLATYPNRSLDALGLHLPAADFAAISRKSFYMNRKVPATGSYLEKNISEPVSIESLETYTSTLLSLHPMLAIDVAAWTTIPNVIASSWNSDDSTEQSQSQSEFWLKSALETINVAIAQNAILSGEPILPQLFEKFHAILAETSDCQTEQKPYCFVRSNQVMARNLLNYYLAQRARNDQFLDNYTKAVAAKSADNMVTILGDKFMNKISVQGDRLALNIGDKLSAVVFPTVDELKAGRILYTADMARLVKLQEKVADELTKVTPNTLPSQEQQFLTKLILFRTR